MTKQATIEPKTKHIGRAFGKTITLDADPAVVQDQVIRTTIPFQMKSLDEKERTIEFIGSTATVDRYGDSVVQTGWELGNFVKNPVIPWGHNYKDPPVAQAIEVGLRDGNLFFKAKFPTIDELSSDPEHPSEWALFVDAIYNSYKGGYLRAFSVGFIPLEYEGNWEDGYTFTKCELLEVSCVTVPANPDALVLAFEEGVLSERQKGIMVKQANKLIKSLTTNEEEKDNEDMNDATKLYIDEKFEALEKTLTDAIAHKEAEAPEEAPAPSEPQADPAAEEQDGGTADDAKEEIAKTVREAPQLQPGHN
jgi:uncharacterized protein